MKMLMEESELRGLAANYLSNRFSKHKIIVPFFDFHKEGMTLSSFLKKRYFGEDLRKLPYSEDVEIRPDILGIIALPETNTWGYVLGEAKARKVRMVDFRQCMNYINIAHPYEGYLFFRGEVTREVKRNILVGNHKYQGLNKWGKLTSKYLNLLCYKRNRFCDGRLDL